METIRLSSKGQIVIPQSIREAHHWLPGVEFAVIDTDQGILFAPIKPFKKTSIQEVRGCIQYRGVKKSLKAMIQGIAKGAKKQK